MLMKSEFFKLPEEWLIQYDIMFSGKRWGKKVEEETLGMMVPVFKGALFSWTWLNIFLPMESGELILCFVLPVCRDFSLPTQLILFQRTSFLTFSHSILPPIPLGDMNYCPCGAQVLTWFKSLVISDKIKDQQSRCILSHSTKLSSESDKYLRSVFKNILRDSTYLEGQRIIKGQK